MLRAAIILGSSRPGRRGEPVAKWVYEIASKRSDAEFELVDYQGFQPPALGRADAAIPRPVDATTHVGMGGQD